MIYDVDSVAVPEQAVLSLRGRGPLGEIGQRMARLRELAAQAGLAPAGPPAARFYADEEGPEPDYDVCLPVTPQPDGSVPDRIEEARGELIPLHHVLQATHMGPHSRGRRRPRLHPERAADRGLRHRRRLGHRPRDLRDARAPALRALSFRCGTS